jgi:Mg/Co/Ni transporter MgtE
MAKLKIRRLPVVEKDKLVGVVTESDILKIAPDLIEITREFAKINSGSDVPDKKSGFCEVCMGYSDDLRKDEGKFVCSWCAESK